jgi:GNAT superfamily N-acetyltransferase
VSKQLGSDDRRAIELNEAEWWSHWGKLRWLNKQCYLLSSSEFREPFFNRLGLFTCEINRKSLAEAEETFTKAGLVPHVTLVESCRGSEQFLRRRGYSGEDEMLVQRLGSATIHSSEEVEVHHAGPGDVRAWVETYLLSFYGDLALEKEVTRIIDEILPMESVTLLVAELGGKVAGATALKRTPGLLGLYCLGTLPKFRNRGVARSLLSAAQYIAISEKRILVLQSLASEETEPFYSKFGFRRLYAKLFLRKEMKGIAPGGARVPLNLGVQIMREPGIGPHLFSRVFHGFERLDAVMGIFGRSTASILSELPVEVVDEEGYMHINTAKGSIVVSSIYLRSGEEGYLYLDAIHELVHIRQHMEGKELWDRRYKYVDRPTELEAYRVAIEEARRIGFSEKKLVDYLKVEWVSKDDFRRFLLALGVEG